MSWDAQTSLLSWSAIRSSEASRFLLCAIAYQLLWRGPVKPRLLTPNLVHMRQPSGFEYAPLGWFRLLQTNSVNHISIFARKLSIALHFLLMKKNPLCCGKLWIFYASENFCLRFFNSDPSVALDLTLKVQLFTHLKAVNSFFKNGLPSKSSP